MEKTLLVVDDAMIMRELIKDAAISAGWTIVGEAQNGEEAFQLYKELKPSLMTIDLVMPEFDGIHGLSRVKEEFPEAKVIVISALDQESVLKKAFSLGAADFIVKPFNPESLASTLDRAVAVAV